MPVKVASSAGLIVEVVETKSQMRLKVQEGTRVAFPGPL